MSLDIQDSKRPSVYTKKKKKNMPRKDRKLPQLSDKDCVFCNLSEDNELKYGKIYQHNGITTHYYCLLLSSNMQQKGSDDEGILGFLTVDILNELKRGRRLNCNYCKKSGATLGCCNTKCKKIFHLPCGLKSGSLHQYFGEFRSYCVNHRPKQKIDERIKSQIPDHQLCYICYDNIDRNNLFETLWAPCCKKNAWFHRECVQQLAMSAGYFFKCPLCNNKKEFQKAMLDNGIFIPCQDASWELVPNAFQELLYRHDRCDATRCKCSKGRKYTSSNPKWELILCRTCGSQGVHVACGKLKWMNAPWDCDECTSIMNRSIDETSRDTRTSNNQNISLNVSDKNNFCDSESDAANSDISVGIEEPFCSDNQWPVVPDSSSRLRIRPGPRSFKLKQQKMLNGNFGDNSGASPPHSESSHGFGESSRASPIITRASVITQFTPISSEDENNQMMSSNRNKINQQISSTIREIVCDRPRKGINSSTVKDTTSNDPEKEINQEISSTTRETTGDHLEVNQEISSTIRDTISNHPRKEPNQEISSTIREITSDDARKEMNQEAPSQIRKTTDDLHPTQESNQQISSSIKETTSDHQILMNFLNKKSKTAEKSLENTIVIDDSDDEPMEIEKPEDSPVILESILTTNNGLSIPVHSVPSNLPHSVRIVGDVHLPMQEKNFRKMLAASSSAANLNSTSNGSGPSIGHIYVGPSDDPIVIGNFQMPTNDQSIITHQVVSQPVIPLQIQKSPIKIVPLVPEQSEKSHDPVMQLKITNVTSLPPEVFASVGDIPATVDERKKSINEPQELVDLESENEEINYHLSVAGQSKENKSDKHEAVKNHTETSKIKNNSPVPQIIEVDEITEEEEPSMINQSFSTPLRTYRSKKKTDEKLKTSQIISQKVETSQDIAEVSRMIQSTQTNIRTYQVKKKIPEKRPAPEPIQQSPLVQKMKTFETNHIKPKRPRIDPSSSSSNPVDEGGVCLKNAAIVNVMGKEFVVPLAKNPRVKVNNTHSEEYDGDAGTIPAETNIPECQRGPCDSMEIQQCQGESRNLYERGSDHSITTACNKTTCNCISSDYRNRLKNDEISIKDLKFDVSHHNRLKITVCDKISIDLELDTVRKRRPGPKSKTLRRGFNHGSSLVRRFLMTPNESKIDGKKRYGESNDRIQFMETSGGVDAVKENVAPSTDKNNVKNYFSSPERKIKRLRTNSTDSLLAERSKQEEQNFYKNLEHPGTSRDNLRSSLFYEKKSSRNMNFFKSKISFKFEKRISLSNSSQSDFHVSIDLNRIEPLLISKPGLFAKYEESFITKFRKLRSFNSLKPDFTIPNGKQLKRSKSLNDLSLSSNLHDFDINFSRKGYKRKRSFEKHDCVR